MALIEQRPLLAEINKWPESVMYKDWVQSAIASAPTIDPIHAAGGCYCRECKYWSEDGRCEPIENGLIREFTRPTDFCSYGEPREAKDDA